MKNKKKRKGFTLVELLVVIAILAVLATVAILGYTQFTKKANIANDQAICSQMNLALQSNEALDNKARYAHQAVGQCQDAGFILENLTPSTANYNFAYDQQHNRFMLLDDKFNFNYGDTQHTKVNDDKNYWIYVVVGSEEELKEANEKGFSTYLRKDFVFAEDNTSKALTTDKGIDVGAFLDVEQIIYNNPLSEQTVSVHTNSFETLLVVNGANDIVNHYGFSYIVDVKDVKSDSYHEYGTVGRLKVNKGRAVVEDTGIVFCAMDIDGSETNAVVEVKGGKVYVEQTKTIEDVNVNKEANNTQSEDGVFHALYQDCGYGHHNWQKLVVDTAHVYEVCTACGYTVKVVGKDGSGNLIYHTSENKNETVSDPTVTVNGNEVTVTNTESSKPEPMGEIDPKEEPIINPTCDHTFEYTDNGDGTHTGKCSKCGLTLKAENHNTSGTDGACSVCGYKEVIQCNNHTFGDNNRCTTCGVHISQYELEVIRDLMTDYINMDNSSSRYHDTWYPDWYDLVLPDGIIYENGSYTNKYNKQPISLDRGFTKDNFYGMFNYSHFEMVCNLDFANILNRDDSDCSLAVKYLIRDPALPNNEYGYNSYATLIYYSRYYDKTNGTGVITVWDTKAGTVKEVKDSSIIESLLPYIINNSIVDPIEPIPGGGGSGGGWD